MIGDLSYPATLAITAVSCGVCMVQAACRESRSEGQAPDSTTGVWDSAPPAGGSSATLSSKVPAAVAASAGREVGLRELVLASLVWPASVAVPVLLSPAAAYARLFPARLRDERGGVVVGGVALRPPLGLALGIGAVVVGQLATIGYHWARRQRLLGEPRPVQAKGAREYAFSEGLSSHVANPEGLLMLGGYLSGTWLLGKMPASYYSFEGGIDWGRVLCCLLLQDLIQYAAHVGEHSISSWVYRKSHKPHHRFTNPRLFDAFNGSMTDTALMILLPLYSTAWLVPSCNVWEYMSFGSLYSTWLTLIHSEYSHPWDAAFRRIGFGTAADHHVHHALFCFNYGHLFLYWDRLLGTYRDPKDVRKFNNDV